MFRVRLFRSVRPSSTRLELHVILARLGLHLILVRQHRDSRTTSTTPADPAGARAVWARELFAASQRGSLGKATQEISHDSHGGCIPEFRAACANGQLTTAKNIAHRLGLTSFEIHSGDNYALRAAIDGDHRDVATWLIQTFYRDI